MYESTPLRIKLPDILAVCNASVGSRNYTEGEQLYLGNHVLLCGTVPTESNERFIKIYGLVQQSSALSSEPHTVKGTITYSGQPSNFICSCKAGAAGQCKHVMAILLTCFSSKDISKLDKISSTDMRCLWSSLKREATEKYAALPVETFCCYNKTRAATEKIYAGLHLNAFNAEEAYQKCTKLEGSALARHYRGFDRILDVDVNVFMEEYFESPEEFKTICDNGQNRNMNYLHEVQIEEPLLCCREFYRKNVLTAINSVEVCTRTAMLRSEWMKERRWRITGSRCRSVYTYKKGNWAEKAMLLAMPKPFTSKIVQHGVDNEPVAREFYARETEQRVVECGLVVVEDHPWMGYSPDGVIFNDQNQPLKLLEIKCPWSGKTLPMHAMLEHLSRRPGGYLNKVENKDGGDTPSWSYLLKRNHSYFSQIQLGMLLLNLPECDFVLFNTKDNAMSIENIIFDEVFCRDLVVRLKSNYFSHLLHQFCSKA